MSRPTLTPEKINISAQIAAATEEFLAKGGQLQEVPLGVSGITMPMLQHWSRITQDERAARSTATRNVYH